MRISQSSSQPKELIRNPQSVICILNAPNREPTRASAKRILLLFTTTGYNAGDFSSAAKELGVEVVPGTDRCPVLDDPWMDGAIPLRFGAPKKSVHAILQYAAKNPISAILAVGDRPTMTAALASEVLGLPYNPPEAVEACRNKLKMRQVLQKNGLAVPDFACYSVDEDPSHLSKYISYPCVLKPLSLSASQGVIRADSPQQFREAFRRIAALLRSPAIQVTREQTHGRILVENYIEGREVALEGILDRGHLRPLALFDKPDPLEGPFFEETLYITPSRLKSQVQSHVIDSTQQATLALGLLDGPVHAELRVNRQGPWIVEVAARSIGGLCSRTLRFGTGMSLEELIIRHALRMRIPSYRCQKPAAGVMMIPIPKPGLLREVTGMEQALAVKGIEEVTITAKVGQKLVPLPEGSGYLGFIFARGISPQKVERRLRIAHRKLQFAITPELPVVNNHDLD
jgi:biotin carboxylase